MDEMLTHEEITVKIYEAVRRTERLLGEKGTDLVAPIREATKQPVKSAPNPPKSDTTELDEIFNNLLAPSRPSYPGAVKKKKATAKSALLQWRQEAITTTLEGLLEQLPEKKQIIDMLAATENERTNPGLNQCIGFNEAIDLVRAAIKEQQA